MEIRHLRYFIAVAETLNFTRAADTVSVAQSALSQQIRRLEGELGAPLFARHSRSVALTEAGRILLPHARRIISDADRAREDFRAYLGLEIGTLRLGLIQSGATAVDLISPIRQLRQRHPGVLIRVTSRSSAEMVDSVVAGELDLAVVGLDADRIPATLDSIRLAADPLVVVVAEGMLPSSADPVSVAELMNLAPLINFAEGTGIRHAVEGLLRRAGVQPQNTLEVTQAADLLRYAALGLGVTVVPAPLALREPDPDLPPVVIRSLADPDAIHPISVAFDRERLSRAASAFLHHLVPDR